MNYRKIIDFIELVGFSLIAYTGFVDPSRVIIFSLFVFAALLIIDLTYYTIEFIYQVNQKKVILFETRKDYNLDFIIKFIPIILFIIAMILNWSKLDIDSSYGLTFGILTFVRGLIYMRLKYSIRIASDRLLFNGFLEKDIFVQEIITASIDSKRGNIKLGLVGNKSRVIKLSEDFFTKQKQQIDGFVDSLNNIA